VSHKAVVAVACLSRISVRGIMLFILQRGDEIIEVPTAANCFGNLRTCSLFPAVCNSIQNPVTKEMLFEFIDRCAAASQGQTRKHHLDPDTELMPPPPPKRPRTIT